MAPVPVGANINESIDSPREVMEDSNSSSINLALEDDNFSLCVKSPNIESCDISASEKSEINGIADNMVVDEPSTHSANDTSVSAHINNEVSRESCDLSLSGSANTPPSTWLPVIVAVKSNRKESPICTNTKMTNGICDNEMSPANVELTSCPLKTTSNTDSVQLGKNTSLVNESMNSISFSDVNESLTVDESYLDIPHDMIQEERKLAYETEREMNKRAEGKTPINNEEKKKRYKTLMNLLGKSNQYATYMSQKLLKEKDDLNKSTGDEDESSKVLQNTTNKRKNTSLSGSAAKKAKTELLEEKYDPKLYYKNSLGLIVSHRQPKLLVGGVMRSYQLDGLDWLIALYKNAVNGILADEMGLGKTIQTISLICHLREKNIFGPHLIIAPLSTLPNWIFEFANFAPEVPCVLFHGNAEKRNRVKNEFIKIMKSKDRSRLPVLLTSYEMPLRDKNFLSYVKWCYTIVDEGHRLKNYNSLLSIELRKYQTESRLLLTGTPLQNNLTELWSLLNYLIPEIFDNLPMFENLFDFSDLTDSEKQNQLIEKEKEEQIVSKMHQILEPFLLRRMKCDVSIALPRKKEILVYAPLTKEQEGLYKCTLDRSVALFVNPDAAPDKTLAGPKQKRKCVLNRGTYSEDWDIDEDLDYIPKEITLQNAKTTRRVKKGNIEFVYNVKLTCPDMMLRKIVNHPYLVKTPVYPGTRDIVIDEKLIEHSGKLLVLDALLPRLKADKHKVLLFSTFTMMLDLIEDYVTLRGHKYVRLDGTRQIEDRLESIKQFNTDPETFIFLISTRAGGLGINLTAADTVILYNSDWNPQVDLQAQDRCHRIGQTRPVVVYRLITAGTVDERIVNCATSKRRLEKLVVKKGKFKQQQTNKEQIDIQELQELLRSTDYKQVIHPNGLVLSDKEINVLLDRSDLLNNTEEENLKHNQIKKSRVRRNSSGVKVESVS